MGPVGSFIGAIFFGVGAGASLTYTIAVGLARIALLSLASKSLTPKIDLSQTAQEKLLTVKSSIQPQAFVYGEDMLSGPLIFGQVETNTKMHRLVALTGREIDSFVGFRIDDTDINIPADIPDASDTVTSGLFADVLDIDTRTGTTTQTAIPQLTTAFPGNWNAAHQARGWSLLHTNFTVEGNNEAFDAGIPTNLRAIVRGHKVYDPRLDDTQTTIPGAGTHRRDDASTWEWSNNPALCLADFYRWDEVGAGEPAIRIDWDLCAAAADICEQQVIIPPVSSPSTTQNRYTLNVTFYGDQSRGSIRKIIEQSMMGRSLFTQGKWRMWAGAAQASTVTLTEANLGQNQRITVQASESSKLRYNAVRGKFVDPSRNYTANAYPPRPNATFEVQDGRRIWKTLDLNGVNNSFECQRDSIIFGKQSRNQKVIRFPGNWSVFRLQPGRTVTIDLQESQLTAQKFIISGRELRQDGSGVSLILTEENDSVWDDPLITDYIVRDPTGDLIPPGAPAVKLSNATISNSRNDNPCTAGVKLEAGGRAKYSTATGAYTDTRVPDDEWLGTGTEEYFVRCTVNSGTLDIGTIDTFESLDTDREYAITQAVSGIDTANITLEITNDPNASPIPILASGTFALSAEFVQPLVSLTDFESLNERAFQVGFASDAHVRFSTVTNGLSVNIGGDGVFGNPNAPEWYSSPPIPVNDYWVRCASLTSGTWTTEPAAVGTWIQLDGFTKDWFVVRTSSGDGVGETTVIAEFELAESSGGPVIASATATVRAVIT